jgi:(1->4)-alpha-D-glucan 1-alpha-D-glucosylmutase
VPAKVFSELLRDETPGAMKLFLIWRALNFRKAHRELFDYGDYVPLSASGEKRKHLCAFARVWKEKMAIVAVPRLVLGLTGGGEVLPIDAEIWRDTVLSLPSARGGDSFRNVLTGEKVSALERDGVPFIQAADALNMFPVALLERL